MKPMFVLGEPQFPKLTRLAARMGSCAEGPTPDGPAGDRLSLQQHGNASSASWSLEKQAQQALGQVHRFRKRITLTFPVKAHGFAPISKSKCAASNL